MNNPSPIQVEKKHYFDQYDSPDRFLHYYHQIEAVQSTGVHTVLEMGVGNKLVYDALKRRGLTVTSCDFDPNLEPDVVSDIRQLPFSDNAFDMVMACEILEHMPFVESKQAMKELARVSKKYVLITLPYASAFVSFTFHFRIPFFQKRMSFTLCIPYFFLHTRMNKKNKEHYWEIGRRGYSKHIVEKTLASYFSIVKSWQPKDLHNHYFFLLEKR